MLRQPVEINAAEQVVNNTHKRFVFLFSILPTFDTVIPINESFRFVGITLFSIHKFGKHSQIAATLTEWLER
jgi:hypothetical protein